MRPGPSSTRPDIANPAIIGACRIPRRGRWFARSRDAYSNLPRTAILMLLGALALGLAPAASSYAATYTVCASDCNYPTIQAAIAAASSGDIISIEAGTYYESGIDVNQNLTIQGQGATSTIVDGGGNGIVFTIEANYTVTIQGLTIQNGFSDNDGGGIYNNGGKLTLSQITLSGNIAIGLGGGIANYGGTLTLSQSTLSGNSATGGGGIFNYGTATIINSTFSDDSASSSNGIGGAIYNVGTITLSDSTIAGNAATYGGGIADDFGGTATVKNSIVANSSGGGGDCYGTVTALGVNLDTDGSCGTSNFTKVTSAQLDLGALALNAPGATETMALQSGSVAIDAADCTDVAGNPVTTDQRGVTRPDNGESKCDIGAYEFVDTNTQFASFTGKLEVAVAPGVFELDSSFTLGAGSTGVNPVTEAVTLQIGPYSVTIPAGSFNQQEQGAYVFEGVINNVSLQLRIDSVGGGSYTLQAEGHGATLTGISNPVTVTLTIGNNTGSAQINAEIG